MRTLTDDATTELLRAMSVKFVNFGPVVFDEIVSRSWASATFVGARHELSFTLEGDGAEAAAEAFIGGLAADEFDLRGHILADISLVSEEIAPGRARIAIEALTVEDA